MHQLEDMKVTLADYLKNYNVTEEQLHEAWHADAKQAIEEHAFLNAFATDRKVAIDEAEFMKFLEAVKGDRKVYDEKAWVESLRSLYFKNKGFEKLLTEVKANLGMKEEKPVNDIQMAA